MTKMLSAFLALVAGLVLGLGTMTPAQASADHVEAVGANALIGRWKGTVEGDGPRYRIAVEFSRANGRVKADVRYPSLRCTGTWRLIKRAGAEWRFRERISRGSADTCESGGLVRIYDLQGERLLFNYGANATRATLRR